MNITKIIVKATKTVRNPYEPDSVLGNEVTIEAEPPAGRSWKDGTVSNAICDLQTEADVAVGEELKARLEEIRKQVEGGKSVN